MNMKINKKWNRHSGKELSAPESYVYFSFHGLFVGLGFNFQDAKNGVLQVFSHLKKTGIIMKTNPNFMFFSEENAS